MIVLIFTFCILNSCSNNSDVKIESFIYSKYFKRSSISKTLDPIKDAKQIVQLTDMPDFLIEKWGVFLKKDREQYKMVSHQYSKEDYHVIMVMVIDVMEISELNKEINIPLSSQYILTIKNDGSIIDGLKVEEGLSKDYLGDDYVDGCEIMNMHKWSEFQQDTIKVYDLMGCIKETSISEREDYIETYKGRVKGILETILQKEFESNSKTTYIIDKKGKMKKINEQKGEMKKLSENIGERIKMR